MSDLTNKDVITKRGKGRIISIDSETYSIPLYVIRLKEGKYFGEIIAITRKEFEIIEDK